MVTLLNILILFLELAGLLYLIYRFGLLHAVSILYGICLIYTQAYLIDHLLFFRPASLYPIYGLNLEIQVFSDIYLKMQAVCLLFFLGFFFTSLSFRESYSDSSIRFPDLPDRKKLLLQIFYLISIGYIIYKLQSQAGLTRLEKGALQTPVSLIINNALAYAWLLVTLNFRDKGKLYYIYSLIVLVGFILSFEREPLLIVLITGLYYYRHKLNTLLVSVMGIMGIIIIAYWKAFYFAFFYAGGTGVEQIAWHIDRFGFSIASIDPVGSNVLLYDYFQNGNIYQEYGFSYFKNFYEQFYRMIFPSDYMSLSEYASEHYVQGKFGLAFSMILESLINLHLFGPLLLGISFPLIFRFIYKYSSIFGPGIIVAALLISVKFIRTELTTLVKLQVIPFFIAFFVIVFLIQILSFERATKNTEHLHSNIQPG